MTKPTREEVEDYIYDSEGETDSEGHDTFYRRLAKAYLAQEEELESYKAELRAWYGKVEALEADNQVLEHKCKMLCCRVGVLEMENQALKAKLNAMKGAHDGRT